MTSEREPLWIPTPDEIAALRRTLEQQDKRIAELEQKLSRAAQYKGAEAYPCPLCRYEDGIFVESCAMHNRIAELETQLSQTWQPLPDGTYHTDGPELVNIKNGELRVYGSGYPMRVSLYQGQAVCRLIESQPTYSHRNGETEPPTIVGWYWFRGNVLSSYRGEVPYSGSVTILDSVYEDRGLCVISTNESPTSNIEKWQGQWYGPIVAPWEDCHE